MELQDFGFELIDGKIIFLTGASSGIGRATAMLLGRAGAKLALMARREDRLQKLAQEIERAGGAKPLLLPGDVRSESECNAAIQSCLERYGRIDTLINNAGVGMPTDLSNVSTETYKAMMETNMDGVFYLTRAVLPVLKKQKSGDIVMVSSGAGGQANPVAPLYCTSKFALEGFTSGLRQQVAQWRNDGIWIRVMNVWPGGVDTEYWGERDVPRETFMTCEEMASILLQVVSTKSTVEVQDYHVMQFRVCGGL